MIGRISLMAAWGALALAVQFAAAQAPPAEAAGPERIAPYVEALRKAEDPATAMAVFNRASSLDRDNVELLDTYIARMTQLGLPDAGYSASVRLTGLQPRHGLAWALIGYRQGKDRKYPEAMSATIRATFQRMDDRSVQHNLGQLAAWYERVPTMPELTESDQRRLEEIRYDLDNQPAFVQGYNRIKTAFLEQETLHQQYEQRIAKAEEDVNSAQKHYIEREGQLMRVQEEISALRGSIDFFRVYSPYNFGYGGVWYGYGYPFLYYGRPTMQRYWRYPFYTYRPDMRVEFGQLARLQATADSIRMQVQSAIDSLYRKQDALEDLLMERENIQERLARHFRWDPPAIKGVVTHELATVPLGPPDVSVIPKDPELDAAQQWDLARSYLDAGKTLQAVTMMQGILEKYGTTRTAEKVKRFLSEHRPQE